MFSKEKKNEWNSPNLAQDRNLPIQEDKWTPKRDKSTEIHTKTHSNFWILKIKEIKVLKETQKNDSLTIGGKYYNDNTFFIRNPGSQKKVAKHCSSIKIKDLLTQNSTSSGNILQEGRKIKIFSDKWILREFFNSRPTLKND